MSHDKPNEEIRELAALCALGALTQHEASSFETHLREGCPVCEAEYRKFRHITAEIGFAAKETAAPDYLRELLLARIEREAPAETPSQESEEEQPVRQAAPAPAAKPVLTPPPRQRSGVFPWILAILLAAAAGYFFYTGRTMREDKRALDAELAGAKTRVQDLETQVNNEKGRNGDLEQIISMVSKPETIIMHLAGLQPAPSTSGAIIWDIQQKQCLIFGYMPPAPQGKQYQLWYLTSNAVIPSDTVKTDPTGRIYQWFPVPEEVAQLTVTKLTMVLTLEPEGGSKTATLPYYAMGRND